jgi:cysteinyl-tRNA synthetase
LTGHRETLIFQPSGASEEQQLNLKVYNTSTRSKEPFVPLVEGKVGMYVCGVTVYDRCHIGHARAYVAFDVVQRYLRHRGFDVTYVRNFTDVDDKIIARAGERGISVNELTDRCIGDFHEDMESLGVARADIEPRVTDHVPGIVAMVQRIVDRGHAYVVDGDVYFDIESYPGYLGLSGRKLEDMKAGASDRLGVEKRTKHPMDFALWKAAKPGEPSWDSPWGPGRPGWHIECSAMSAQYLGDVFDIHGGGADLVFPHHENERAQSWACCGGEFVRYWMHNGFVNVDSEKMSKSLGNFFTIREVVERYHPESLRYFLMTTHYRSPINFHDGAITEAENRVEYLYETVEAARSWLASNPATPDAGEQSALRERFAQVMDDDFNTAAALGLMADASRKLNETLARKGKAPEKSALAAALLEALVEQGSVLGLCQRDPRETLSGIQERKLARSGMDRQRIDALVAERTLARAERDFARADMLRGELSELGVIIMDGPEGTRWKVA